MTYSWFHILVLYVMSHQTYHCHWHCHIILPSSSLSLMLSNNIEIYHCTVFVLEVAKLCWAQYCMLHWLYNKRCVWLLFSQDQRTSTKWVTTITSPQKQCYIKLMFKLIAVWVTLPKRKAPDLIAIALAHEPFRQ